MKGRHQADLVWRFRFADSQVRGVPSSFEIMRKHWLTNGASTSNIGGGFDTIDSQLTARERSGRIDRVLDRLPKKPISLARVLFLRYGLEEHVPSLAEVLPNVARIAAMTAAAKEACERHRGAPARPRSNDVVHWLEGLCNRVAVRALRDDDLAVLADVRAECEQLLIDAESAYESLAERSTLAA